ncbi:hypothetical protein SEUCBS139899_009537 [Sporothrix eucalyptigena]|uniref:Uncharacterized protein n=1 Tax=Sporothrix eucalyptigena TaxID=1812306 RepID=A0ABP0BY06_9PEZI
MAAQQPPRSQALLEVLDQTIADVLIHAGKAIRAQSKNGRKVVGSLSATKISDANTAFNSTLDSIETDILRAKSTLRRDLDLIRAQKSVAAAAAAAPKKEATQNGVTPLHQAPAAAMDIDSDEPKITGVNIKVEPNTDTASNGSNSLAIAGPATTTSMAPFPNMDLDSPTTITLPTGTASAMQPSISNRSAGQAPQPPSVKSPAVKKETLSRSPEKTTKPVPTPGSTTGASLANIAATGAAGAAAANKAPPRKRTVSPAAVRVPSPAASRSTASPAATKVPSPVLVKSTAGSNAGSPAIGKAATPQPPTPTPAVGAAAGAANKTISLSPSSSSPSVTAASPVLTKKPAVVVDAAKSTPHPMKSTTPVPAPRIPTSITAPVVPLPTTIAAPPTVTPIAPPVPPTAAPVRTMETSSNDINMDDFFDLTGPSGAGDSANSNLGFTNMQFSLAPAVLEEVSKTTQPQPPAPAPAQQPSAPMQTAASAPQPAAPPQTAQMDDSEFDVESFTADAVQNLLMDTSLPTAPVGQLRQQLQQSTQPQQSQSNDITLTDPGAAGAGGADISDPADDLFNFINDNMEGLVDDPTTNFDELYMGGTDSIDIDNYFDTN